MENFVSIVVLMGLVIVQGSSLFEQVIKNVNRNDNELNKDQKVSRGFLKLTDDTSDLEIKDNRNAIRPSSIGDKRKFQYGLLLDLINPISSFGAVLTHLKNKGAIAVDANGHIPHSKDTVGNIADITLTIIQLPYSSDVGREAAIITPEIMSVTKDLQGLVQCHNYTCTINVLGLSITAGYNPVPTGVFLSIDFFEFSIVNEKISVTGFRYCEPIDLPTSKAKICIEVSDVELSNERACLNLGFSILGYSYTFPDLCIFGSRKPTS